MEKKHRSIMRIGRRRVHEDEDDVSALPPPSSPSPSTSSPSTTTRTSAAAIRRPVPTATTEIPTKSSSTFPLHNNKDDIESQQEAEHSTLFRKAAATSTTAQKVSAETTSSTWANRQQKNNVESILNGQQQQKLQNESWNVTTSRTNKIQQASTVPSKSSIETTSETSATSSSSTFSIKMDGDDALESILMKPKIHDRDRLKDWEDSINDVTTTNKQEQKWVWEKKRVPSLPMFYPLQESDTTKVDNMTEETIIYRIWKFLQGETFDDYSYYNDRRLVALRWRICWGVEFLIDIRETYDGTISPNLSQENATTPAAQTLPAAISSTDIDYDQWLSIAQKNPIEALRDVPVYVWLTKANSLFRYPYSVLNDKKKIMAAIQRDGRWLLYASPELRNDKDVVLAAIQNCRNGEPFCDVVKLVSHDLRNDEDVIMAVIKKDRILSQYESLGLQSNRDVFMAAMQDAPIGIHLRAIVELAPPDLRGEKGIVMAVVRKDGTLLQYASSDLRNDREVLAVAARNDSRAIQFASPELLQGLNSLHLDWFEKVAVNGLELQHAPIALRNNKRIAMMAIYSDPNAIKYVSSDVLKRDRDILIAAGMFDKDHHVDRPIITSETEPNTTTTKARKITLSTRFSLDQSSKSEATNFTRLLKAHEYIQSFKIYSPNAFDKRTCDPNWTDFDHPCRGTYDTCQFESKFKTGHPTDECCWRYSYRYHLQDAKNTGGFMIQLIESNTSVLKKEPPTLGKGQEIERDMAAILKMKVFHVYRPINHRFGGCEWYFDMSHVETVVAAIRAWYDEGCRDMSECIVRP